MAGRQKLHTSLLRYYIVVAVQKQRKDKGEKLTQARAGFKAQMEKFSKSLAREDFESALTMKTELRPA